MSRRTFTFSGYESTLTSPITNVSTVIALASTTGLQAPCYLAIEADSLSLREIIRVDSISAPNLENVTRGLAGSVGGAQAHSSGVRVRAVIPHQLIDDVFLDIGELESGASGHYGGIDVADHPEAVAGLSRGFMSAASKLKLDGIETGAEVNPLASEILAQLLTSGSILGGAEILIDFHADRNSSGSADNAITIPEATSAEVLRASGHQGASDGWGAWTLYAFAMVELSLGATTGLNRLSMDFNGSQISLDPNYPFGNVFGTANDTKRILMLAAKETGVAGVNGDLTATVSVLTGGGTGTVQNGMLLGIMVRES